MRKKKKIDSVLFHVLTCGIGFLWLMPYMQATKANFYLDLVKKN